MEFNELKEDNEIDFSEEDREIMIDKVENFYAHFNITDAMEIRQAFAILEPKQGFREDDEIYNILENLSYFQSKKLHDNYEQDLFNQKSFDAYENYIETIKARKLIFPEKNNQLYQELEEKQIHKRLLSDLENEHNELFSTYLILQDIKTLYPETINNLHLIDLCNLNHWSTKQIIKKDIQNFISEELYESALIYMAAINTVNTEKENKIIIDENEKKMFLEYINQYKNFNLYGDYATYMLLLKTILAKDIEITRDKFNLIF